MRFVILLFTSFFLQCIFWSCQIQYAQALPCNTIQLTIKDHSGISNLLSKPEAEQKELSALLKKDAEIELYRKSLLCIGFFFGLAVIIFVIIIMHYRFQQIRQKALLAEEKSNRMDQFKRINETALEKIRLKSQLTEQELVYQSLVSADLSHANRSIREKLAPYALKIARKKDQDDFRQLLYNLTKEAGKDPMADFEIIFRQLHGSFYEKMLATCPDLSKAELQVCALIRLNLNSKEIARLVNLSVTTIEITRHHIRKKLALGTAENLTAFLITI